MRGRPRNFTRLYFFPYGLAGSRTPDPPTVAAGKSGRLPYSQARRSAMDLAVLSTSLASQASDDRPVLPCCNGRARSTSRAGVFMEGWFRGPAFAST